MNVLIIDNYDSFTFNLVHYFEGAEAKVTVLRNDEVSFNDVENCDQLVFSPGPGLPAEAGKMPYLIQSFAGKKPMLGVCLGFQAIVEFYHGELYNQEKVKHGKAEPCSLVTDSRLFDGMPDHIQVGLYHSWAAKPDRLPRELICTATSENGVIMAVEHKRLPIAGVQFHPESILTEHGHQIVRNFIQNFR